nr:chromate transporter [Lachnospiraceae bacterium]
MVLLFAEFFKIGLFAVGGGPATLPFLMDLTEKYDWFSMEQLTNMVAISESTPGPLGLNMATYAGVQTIGVFGGLISTMGLVIPSIIVITIIAKFMEGFSENRFVKAAFYGIRPAVTALIAAAVFGICKVSLFAVSDGQLVPEIKTILLCVFIFGLLQIKKLSKIHPVLWILSAAVIGVVFRF